MKKINLIFKYFQKKDLLTITNKDYQNSISSLFNWMITNDKVYDDKSSKYLPNNNSKAKIISQESGIIAGMEEVGFLINKFTKLQWKPKITNDGAGIKKNEVIAQINGKTHEILAFERTILNILQRMSGIATETKYLLDLINPIPYTLLPKPYLAATRKTPWMSLDKKAVAVGGGLTHRLNLSDGILIKDNHLVNLSIVQAIKTISNNVKDELIEIEVETPKQAYAVIKTFKNLTANYPARRCYPPTIRKFGRVAGGQLTTHNHLAILLDNFTPSAAKSLLSNLGHLANLSQIIFEASGGITPENIKEWSQSGVDILSLGALTHSARALNLSLDFIKGSAQK